MVYKSLRNKAFSGEYRIIKSQYKSKVWTGTGSVMVQGDFVEDYKYRNDQYLKEVPDLEPIMDMATGYTPIETALAYEEDERDLVALENKNRKAVVQKRFYDFVKTIFPEAEIRLAGEFGHQFSPVRFYNNHELVAVIMPLDMR